MTKLSKKWSNEFWNKREQYFEIQDLKAQLQDKGIAISELIKLIEELKGKSLETKFEKSSIIRQLNAFKRQRQSILGKPATFSDSLTKKDFSKPVTVQILPQNVKSGFKNTNVIAPKMYKLDNRITQTKTTQLPPDLKKTNKRVTFSTRVIATTSVSRPQLKSNPLEHRVLPNNSEVKTKAVEEHHRNFKFSKHKLFVTACNDSLNVKTSNVNFLIEIILFIVDSRCAKHMTGNLKLLSNFVEKFLGTVKFRNDQIASILRYGDLNLDKMKTKGDACIFVGYSTQSRAYRSGLPPQCQTMVLDQIISDPVSKCLTMIIEIVTTSNDLDLLFSLMFDELFNGSSPFVSKSSAVPAADVRDNHQQQDTTPSTSTTVAVDSLPLNIPTTPAPASQAPIHIPLVTPIENINQAESQDENIHIEEDEFVNIFSTPVLNQGETSS
ncbi:hypothetical protein Tco_0845141 [Tanacetum coccineum]